MDETRDTTAEPEDEGGKSRASRARDAVNEKFSAASDTVREKYGKASDAARRQVSSARAKLDEAEVSEWPDRVRQYVRENPGKALIASVGIGFLIGLLLRSDDDDE